MHTFFFLFKSSVKKHLARLLSVLFFVHYRRPFWEVPKNGFLYPLVFQGGILHDLSVSHLDQGQMLFHFALVQELILCPPMFQVRFRLF